MIIKSMVAFNTVEYTRPRGYKSFIMLISTKHEIYPTHNYVKIAGILPFISRMNATTEASNTRTIFIQVQRFRSYGELKFHAQLSCV